MPIPPPTAWTRPTAADPPLHGSRQADVVVVGAGIVGLAAATMLADDGAEVVVLSADAIGDSVTGRSSAKVTALHQVVYADLARRHGAGAAASYAQENSWALGWVREHAGPWWTDATAVTVARDVAERTVLEREAQAARGAGLDTRLVLGADGVPGWDDATAVLRLAGQGQVDPVGLLQHLRAQLPPTVTVHEHSRVTGLTQRLRHAEVRTSDGSVRADDVVVATGMPILDRSGMFALCEAQTSYVVALEHPGPAADHDVEMLITAGSPTRSVRWARRPDADGWMLLVGGEGHRTGTGAPTRPRYDALEGWARQRFGDVGTVLARWSAEDFMSPDLLPWAGPVLRLGGNVHMVTGLSKWGFTLGVASARAVVQRIGGHTRSDFARLVDPARLPDLPAGGAVVSSNVEVARHMTTGWIGALTGSAPDDPPEGSGGVGRRGLRPRATCRVDGVVQDVSAVCPHLGGIVSWNDGDRTWDCPLHGSRFTHDGAVRHGPATRGLTGEDSR